MIQLLFYSPSRGDLLRTPFALASQSCVRLPLFVVALAFGIAPSVSCYALQFTVTDLGPLNGKQNWGQGISANGLVAGTGFASESESGGYRAFRHVGSMQSLGTLPGHYDSYGLGINNSGHVVGASTLDSIEELGLHAFLYDDSMHDLGTLGGARSWGFGINNSSDVVGMAETSDGDAHAYLYTRANGMVDLNGLVSPPNAWSLSRATAINDAGQIVGDGFEIGKYVPGVSENHAVLIDGSKVVDLGTLGGRYSFANGISSTSLVVGYSRTAAGLNHAFIYDGTMRDLTPTSGGDSTALGVNSAGWVVGYSGGSIGFHSRALLFTLEWGAVDLNTLIDPKLNFVLNAAMAINDAGQITGWGSSPAGNHTFLLTPVPVPEPSSLTLFVLCLSFFAMVRAGGP